MRVVDSHQHLWTIGAPGQSWPDADWPAIFRDFTMADLRGEAKAADLVATVLVQSQPDARDTAWMIAEVAEDPLVRAIVGWADMLAADAPERIRALAGQPKLRGLRPMLQSIEDSAWLLQPALDPAIEAMIETGLRLDALIEPRHLTVLAQVAKRWPALPIVIDHAAKPRMAEPELGSWRDGIAKLAALPNLWCKLSGLRTEQPAGQPAEALAPVTDHLVKCFGDRLMWGSDWPVLRITGDLYPDWLALADRLTGLAPDRRDRLFFGAANDFYALGLD